MSGSGQQIQFSDAAQDNYVVQTTKEAQTSNSNNTQLIQTHNANVLNALKTGVKGL